MAQQRIHSMTQGHPTRLLLMFALPLMVGNVFQQLYTVVDTAVVGQFVGVGALALPRRGSSPGGAGAERAPGRGPAGGKIIFWDILQRAFDGDKIGSMRHLDSTAGQGTRRRENGAKAAPAPRRPFMPKTRRQERKMREEQGGWLWRSRESTA